MIRYLYFLLLLSLFLPSNADAQTVMSSRFNVKLDTCSVGRYYFNNKTDSEFKTIFLKTNYGGYEITDKNDLEKLTNATIMSIDLVYTAYPADEDFTELNRRRIEFLHLLCPSVFNNTMTSWRIVAQRGCKNELQASSMPHGFFVHYRPGPTKESAERELTYLKEVLSKKETVTDSSMFKIFMRNKWKNMTVVSDFTGSMSPYIAQVLLWYNLTFATKDFSEFIFFNDGDEKADSEKKTGKTGGIYYCKSANKDSVLKIASLCSKSGFGGDIQENNIEAALEAIKKNPKTKEIIMVVDNWAPMRDYALMSQIKIPVHVIICGKPKDAHINTEYLDLAWHTKGSIHTIEEDIQNLSSLAEGKTIVIEKVKYKISGGRFIKLSIS
jgi:hypothetical protein